MIRVNCHPYPNRVWFTTDRKAFGNKSYILTGTEYDSRGAGCCSWDDDNGRIVVGVFDRSPATLAHELIHASMRVFHFIGMEMSPATEEAFCYLAQSMHEQCWRYMTKQAETHE